MGVDFRQMEWDEAVEDDCRQIVRLAVREDLDRLHDWTTVALVPHAARGEARVIARSAGVIAGLKAAEIALDEMDAGIRWCPLVEEGMAVATGVTIARMSGPLRNLLTCERLLLNLLARLSGIATLTRQYVDAVSGTKARIYDTRKTTPGWRRLEKFAVRCGGGHNHRTGLFDAVLIKDNHLLATASETHNGMVRPSDAVTKVREFLRATVPQAISQTTIVEVEVDTLEQLDDVLPVLPDIVLLDNMSPDMLRQAVARRNRAAPGVELEASGGIELTNVAEVASTGVDRISVGALTHAAASLDLSLELDQTRNKAE